MTETPETLFDDEGKWARRDVFLKEFVDEYGEEKANECLDDLIEDGPLREKDVGDYSYVQLESWSSGVKMLAKGKAKMKKNQAVRFLSRD